jgi:hypothetical protein
MPGRLGLRLSRLVKIYPVPGKRLFLKRRNLEMWVKNRRAIHLLHRPGATKAVNFVARRG